MKLETNEVLVIMNELNRAINSNDFMSETDRIIARKFIAKAKTFGTLTIEKEEEEETKPLHITEQKYPEQTKRFREILDEMYAVHLKKNADYSPYNILVTGMRGCVTRLWDKSARFFNLMGLDIGTYVWTEEKMNMVEDEDVNQTIIDWANYCVITRILREGKWGK